MSLIDERGDKRVRMANLALRGQPCSQRRRAIHSNLLKQTVLRDFAEMGPEKFTNVTNGVTPRRFLLLANPGLAALITEAIGDDGRDLDAPARARGPLDDAAFLRTLAPGQAAQQASALAAYTQNARHRALTRTPCSTCRSSASTSTSAST